MAEQKMTVQANAPIPMEGTHNTRSLGGYINKDGQAVKENRFFRSDSTSGMTEKDVETLRQRGLVCVIDLRSDFERIQAPSVYKGANKADYYEIPLLDGVASNGFSGSFPANMGQLYVELLQNQAKAFAQVFKIIAAYNKKGAVLYHCMVGKDRTGLVSMFLLDLAGVDRKTILTDYSTSEENMKPVFEQQKRMLKEKFGLDVPDAVFSSAPKELLQAMQYLDQQNLSPEEYLLQNGVFEQEIAAIKEMLLN